MRESLDRRITRRDAIKLGAGAAAAALAGCGRPARRSGATPLPGSTHRPSAAGPAAGNADWDRLRAALSGRLVRPGDDGYLTDLQLYDPRFDSVRPEGIAYCATVADVQRCVDFARTHGLPFAARSGGHSYGGYSTSTGLVVDVTSMSAVQIGPRSATIGAGARLIDVYSALNAEGVSIPAGSCPTVGIAGLALGGGVGVVDRAQGLTCDVLTSLVVVTADSRVVTADAASNPDLYWACRGGGGGNFGIATSLTFSTFGVSPLTLVFLDWPWAAVSQVLPAWLEWLPGLPDPLWSNLLLEAQPGAASPKVQVGVVWSGPSGGEQPLVRRLVAAVGSSAQSDYSETVPFAHAMYVEGGCASFSRSACHLPDEAAGGLLTRQPSLAKSGYLSGPLPDAGVQAVVAGVSKRQDGGRQGAVGFDAYGGAINRVDPAATAFVHRSALASGQFNVPFDPGTPSDTLLSDHEWLDSWYASVGPYLDGHAYQNYIDPHLPDWLYAYYGANLQRLRAAKSAWDPDDVFRFAQSIPPL